MGHIQTRVVNDSGIRIRFQNWSQSLIYWNRNWNQNHMMLELESESESSPFGKHWNRNQNRNQFLLESELESESWIFVNPGIGIRIRISPSGIGVRNGIIKNGNSGIGLV